MPPDITESLQVGIEQASNQSSMSLSSQQTDAMDDHMMEYGMTVISAAISTDRQSDEVMPHSAQSHNGVSASEDPSPQVISMSGKAYETSLQYSEMVQGDAEPTSDCSFQRCSLKDKLSDIGMHGCRILCEMEDISIPTDADKETSITEFSSQYQVDPAYDEIGPHLDHISEASAKLNSNLEV